MGTLALRVTDAAKSFYAEGRAQAVFHSLDLQVKAGEIFALLGPSGCGKSTLLRVIAGLERLTAGRVDLPAIDRGAVAIVFQDPLLLPWLTVAENVALGLRYRANRRVRAAESVEALLHDFGLATVAGAYPDALSGGQAQRASLARAIVTQPRLLLLDEPFASLDPRTRAALQDWLLELTRQRGLTVVIVTHDLDEALYLGDRVGLMSPRPGTPLQVWPLERHDRRRATARTEALRAEILAQYQTDVAVAATHWTI